MERHVVDGGYVTNYNDPVVGIKPINQKSIETAMSGKKILIFGRFASKNGYFQTKNHPFCTEYTNFQSKNGLIILKMVILSY